MVKIYLTYQEVKQLHIIRRHFLLIKANAQKKRRPGGRLLVFVRTYRLTLQPFSSPGQQRP